MRAGHNPVTWIDHVILSFSTKALVILVSKCKRINFHVKFKYDLEY
jgi:hypothetical protein